MFGLTSRLVMRAFGMAAFRPKFQASEKGATAVEYGLLLAFIAAAIIGTVTLLGPALEPGFQAAVDGF
jgi:pilus assembly protein Flp/PilA